MTTTACISIRVRDSAFSHCWELNAEGHPYFTGGRLHRDGLLQNEVDYPLLQNEADHPLLQNEADRPLLQNEDDLRHPAV